MTTHGMSEVDEKWVDTSVGHVSQDDGLALSKWQVNPEPFAMGQECQSTTDTYERSLIQKIR